jgi:hypothetical protein
MVSRITLKQDAFPNVNGNAVYEIGIEGEFGWRVLDST